MRQSPYSTPIHIEPFLGGGRVTAVDLSTDRLSERADDLYAELIDAHSGLGEAESRALNARLVLLLFNLVGDADAIVAAIRAARFVGAETSGGIGMRS